MEFVTQRELEKMFRPDDDVDSIEVCLEILFKEDGYVLWEKGVRIDTSFKELARKIYHSFARMA